MVRINRLHRMLFVGLAGVPLLMAGCPVPARTGEEAQPPGPGPGPDPHQSLNNRPPTADAGADQAVSAGQIVTLDGTSSADPDHNQLSYVWSQVSGDPVLEIQDAFSAIAHVQTPADLKDAATLVFSLTVSDGFVASVDQVQIIIQPRHAP
jgi:hypothetical protein